MFGISSEVMAVLNNWCKHSVSRKEFIELENYAGFCLPSEEWKAINAAFESVKECKLFYWKSGDKFVAINLYGKITAAGNSSAVKFFQSTTQAFVWRDSFRIFHEINESAAPKPESEWTLHIAIL